MYLYFDFFLICLTTITSIINTNADFNMIDVQAHRTTFPNSTFCTWRRSRRTGSRWKKSCARNKAHGTTRSVCRGAVPVREEKDKHGHTVRSAPPWEALVTYTRYQRGYSGTTICMYLDIASTLISLSNHFCFPSLNYVHVCIYTNVFPLISLSNHLCVPIKTCLCWRIDQIWCKWFKSVTRWIF